MPARYDPLIAVGLAHEIVARWHGRPVRALRMDAGRRAAELELDGGEALLALLAPGAGFVCPGAAGTLDGPAVRSTPFRGVTLAAAWTPPDERALLIGLAGPEGGSEAAVAFELRTNHWNLLYLSPAGEPAEGPFPALDWTIVHALWPRDAGGRRLRAGARYVPPESTRRAIAEPPAKDDWRASLEAAGGEDVRGAVLREWAWTSALNIGWILGGVPAGPPPAGRATHDPAKRGDDDGGEVSGSRADADRAYERYLDIHARTGGDGGAWIIPRPHGPQPYPAPLGHPGARRAASLLDALAEVCEEAGGPGRALERSVVGSGGGDDDEENRLRRALERAARRLRRRRAALGRQRERTGEPEEARAAARLLLVRKDLVKRGLEEIRLEDFDGSVRRIELDPALDAVSNAERYFAEARRRARARARIPAELADTEARLARLGEALRRLASDGPDEELWELVGGRPRAAARGDGPDAPRLPYTRLASSGGLEIRVGRGARDNDELTFRHSSPEDIWLHARQTSGAHVILRWDRRDQNPPQRDLLEAAVAAAVHSGARHSGTVAVVWTRRKYVRKPRKAPPGTVAPDRVQTLFVEPDDALVERMRRR